jgi:asparagine synthase (glutamine-hydrolysing)
MCGIAGILKTSPNIEETRRFLESVRSSLRHRGPDDSGEWFSANGVAGFAHVRLSILDLSPGGHQPMSLAGGRFTIVFNGEIYNFRSLRQELQASGAVFQTQSDTEVLLHLYARHGRGMLDRLRGMYAFALWDEQERSCLLARDSFGIKPLYFCHSDNQFVFASELHALQSSRFVPEEINGGAVVEYFEAGSVPEPMTLVKDVYALEAGHSICWKDGKLDKQCHWSIRFPGQKDNSADHIITAREALIDSVSHHFVSDVPVGIFLSGGIDSTALVALARHTRQDQFKTFSIGVDDPALSESDIAKKTAAHFKTEHHEMTLDERRGRDLFESFLGRMDQPSIDGFNTYTVSAFAKEKGMKVVLSGLGGDEMFGGYRSFSSVPQLRRVSRMAGLLPGARAILPGLLIHSRLSNRLRRFGAYLSEPPTLQGAYRCFRGIFTREESERLAAHYAGYKHQAASKKHTEMECPTPEDAVSQLELSLYMRNQLLRDSDVMSMAHGLELRVPFVDRMLFDRVASIPASFRLQAGKRLLLSAVPEIPDWVANQPKRGFVFPFQRWLDGVWGDGFDKVNGNSPVRLDTWYQRWSVFVLHHWMQKHGMKFAN